MKKISKIIAFLLVSILLLGCFTVKKERKYTIGFSQLTNKNDWRKAMNRSMQIEAGFYSDTQLIIRDAKANVDKQIEDIEKFIKEKVDVIIVSPIAPKPLKGILDKAIKSGIPVVVLDRKISNINYSSFVGTDNKEVGVNAANFIANKNIKANILEIKGWAGTTPTLLRSEGFELIVNNNANLKLAGFIQDRYDSPGIKEAFEKFIKSNPDINYVYAHNDDLAFQAYEVAKELQLTKSLNFIGIGGVNVEKGGLSYVKKNILEASVLYPTGGKEAFKVAIDLLNNKKVKKDIILPSVVISSSNVDLLLRQAELITNQEVDIEKQQAKIDEQIKLYSSQKNFLIATLIFLAVIALLLFFTFKDKIKLSKQKKLLVELIDQIANQKNEIERIAEDLRITNEATNNFFTGVSHDFKTPISLILSSTESLLTKDNEKKPIEFSLIYNNSKRLLRMINQLLDFRRVGSKKFRLKASKTNIFNFVNSIYQDFKAEANKKEIEFKLTTNTESTELYIDRDLFDNVLFNLLSNAFKFTPTKGVVTVNIKDQEKDVVISVKDSGIGILPSEKDKIFNQFFLGSNNKQTSSGIGLYLTKEYIKLHRGTVEVHSKEGEGAEFVITIPKGHEHFKADEIIVSDEIKASESIDFKAIIFDETTPNTNTDEEKESVLVIEDNTDLRNFLVAKLSEQYNVYESDGINAINKALEVIPDIIVSDVNLPEKNGFEICEALKNDVRTSHIPVIILTALSSDEAHLQGLKSGVDMFLTKPFNLSVLNQSLKTLLYNRKKLQRFYNEHLATVIPTEIVKKKTTKKTEKRKDIEREFLENINSLILKNLDDSTFTVEILAEELGISRVQLYRKTKAVLGLSISDHMQGIRLQKSKEMLLDDSLSIADVAYSVGFSSPNYFSTAFKNKYNKSPNQFKKDKQ
ncbi:substrate-binding domain-containing protein [Tenacibaculum sp. IB213877]|uniref:substrate-binding domain-containing protein n=1 Tax=Tenacibaculum sp. IB213877 TaxID=3097351 RepID=UPI002A59F54E|nr:substrate-binding domain-containing protein [Tenacibaculum sp. IB213877]MDY0780761.1 substrate-binding domain-containing protein [Tenacibaculum sp. IB213877]